MSNTIQDDEASQTKNDVSSGNIIMDDHERWLRYKELVRNGKISKNYMKNGTKIEVLVKEIEDKDWNIVLEEVCNKEYPLRELKLKWGSGNQIEPTFIELTNAIGAHTTLTKLDIDCSYISIDNCLALVFKALQDNRSIKYLKIRVMDFSDGIATVLAQSLMNNKTLLSFILQVWIEVQVDNHCFEEDPISLESITDLAHSLQTTALERLTINKINNEGLKVLVQFLPKTLVHLDLSSNELTTDSIPIIRSYLQSNGSGLKYLIQNTSFAQQYLEQQELSALSAVKILDPTNWQTKFFYNEEFSILDPIKMHDDDWSILFMELTKDNTIRHRLKLILSDDLNPKELNYIGILLGEQFRFTSLTITDYLPNVSAQIQLFRKLEENICINELRLDFQIDPDFFIEFSKFLAIKNNIIRLDMPHSTNISDKEAIILADSLNTNTVLQSVALCKTQIGDIGFQALLSSLPNSLLQLKLEETLITAKSLPYLLDFIKTHSLLTEISLDQNDISSSSSEVNVAYLVEEIAKMDNTNHCICYLGIINKIKKIIAQSTDGKIKLYDENLRDDHIFELFNELKTDPNRNWSLDLRKNNRISSVGYRYLGDTLSSTIAIIDLAVDNMDEAAGINLLNGLCNNKTLNDFILYSSKINNLHMEYIGRFIQNNLALKNLRLCWSDIDDDGIIHLAKFLPESNLETLHLYHNLIGDRGCANLLSSIPSTLKTLLLSDNVITDASLQTILTFLTTNQTLKCLSIHSNPVCGENFWDYDNNTLRQQISKQNNICKVD